MSASHNKEVCRTDGSHLWNAHNTTLNNNARTNNICKGWNDNFFNLVGHYHPSFWRVIEWCQRGEATVRTIIQQDVVGAPLKEKFVNTMCSYKKTFATYVLFAQRRPERQSLFMASAGIFVLFINIKNTEYARVSQKISAYFPNIFRQKSGALPQSVSPPFKNIFSNLGLTKTPKIIFYRTPFRPEYANKETSANLNDSSK